MPRRTPKSVDADERRLCELVVAFANDPMPSTTNTVYMHFLQHPFASRSRFWRVLDEPEPVALEILNRDRLALREALARIASRRDRESEARRVGEQLTALLTIAVPPLVGLDTRIGLPLGQLRVRFILGKRLALEFEPWLTGVSAALHYGLALLLDDRRGFGRGLHVCRARRDAGPCGNVFWRRGGPRAYCDACTVDVKLGQSRDRQETYRKRLWVEETALALGLLSKLKAAFEIKTLKQLKTDRIDKAIDWLESRGAPPRSTKRGK